MANTDRLRKCVVVFIEPKLSVLSVTKGVGYSEPTEKFGIGRSLL